jgi:uncharacterized protein YbcI
MSEGAQERSLPDQPGSVLTQISNEVVRTLKESYGKGPDRAKAYLLDDVLLIVMRGGATTVEQTLLEAGEGDMVRNYRQLYQNHMGDRLIGIVERATGRKVATYQSQVLFWPFTSIEIFLFADREDDAILRN